MPIDILMPALSPTMEQGKLAKWLKAEGDKIKAGDIIAEIETDKATMEVEAVDEGVLAKILIADGTENVAVNTPIAVIAADGEDVSAAKSGGGKAQPAPQAAESAPPAAAAEAPKVEPAPKAESAVAAPPQPKAYDASSEFPAGADFHRRQAAEPQNLGVLRDALYERSSG